MEMLAVIGLVGNIVQFLDFSGQLISKSIQLHQSSNGALEENTDTERATNRLVLLNNKLKAAADIGDRTLEDLCKSCEAAADELLAALNKVKVKNKQRKWESIRKALRTVWSKEEIEKLERRLARFREQLNLHVTVDLRDRVYQFKLEQSNSFKDLDLAIKNIMNAIIERDVFQINMMKVLQSEVANTRHELLQEIRDTRSAKQEYLPAERPETPPSTTSTTPFSRDPGFLDHRVLLDQGRWKGVEELKALASTLKDTREDFLPILNKIHDAHDSLDKRMKEFPRISSAQYEDLTNLLKMLPDQLARISALMKSSETMPKAEEHRSRKELAEDSSPATVVGDTEVLESIERLGRLVQKPECIMAFGDLQEIVDDLQTLLQAAWKQDSVPPKRQTTAYDKRSIWQTRPVGELRDLKRIGDIFCSSPSVSINGGIKRRRPCSDETIIQQEYKRKEYDTKSGILTVNTNKKRRLPGARSSQREHSIYKRELEDFTATISFMPRNTRQKFMISASIQQGEFSTGSISVMPNLSANPILPVDSLIFTVVKQGRMEEFMQLLQEGRASVRDRDEHGTPLLHYAAGSQPHMCKFLIEHGADVDEIAPNWYLDYDFMSTPLQMFLNDSDLDEEELIAANESRRFLLSSGADPTININPDNSGCPFTEACSEGNIEAVRLFLDLGAHIVNLELKDDYGRTPFLLRCGNFIHGCSPEELDFFLKRGANLHARDASGATCLHSFIRNACRASSTERNSLNFMVQRGADIHAKDCIGRSVSEIAYTYIDGDYDGGYRGDLWDSVLAENGRDISEFRRDYPRRPQYTERYTRRHFEYLWKGREDLCPYYNDPDVWDPDPDYTAELSGYGSSEEADEESDASGEQDCANYQESTLEEDSVEEVRSQTEEDVIGSSVATGEWAQTMSQLGPPTLANDRDFTGGDCQEEATSNMDIDIVHESSATHNVWVQQPQPQDPFGSFNAESISYSYSSPHFEAAPWNTTLTPADQAEIYFSNPWGDAADQHGSS